MPTYILTWNAEKTSWDELADDAEQTAQGISIPRRWSTGNTKRIQPGDRLFLLKQGPLPRGIIGIGEATSTVYSDEHWNGEGKPANYVDLDVERVLDPSVNDPLSTDNFKGPLGEVYWRMPASGLEIKEPAAQQLETAWAEHVRQADEAENEEVEEQSAHRNSDWQRDELILGLDFYFRYNPNTIKKTHLEVGFLTGLLNTLAIQFNRSDEYDIRTTDSVYLMLCNFLTFEPDYRGKRLTKSNGLQNQVWEQYASKPVVLRGCNFMRFAFVGWHALRYSEGRA